MATPITNSIAGILAACKEVFSWLIGNMADVVSLVLGQPLLFIPIGIVATYAVINLFKRIF